SVADNAARGCFMDKIFNRIAIILDRIANHNHAWHGRDQSGGLNLDTPLSHLMKENRDHD
ncbi:hypothetical protein HAX54_026129, partial [Datura stramonium]|nr:hypothetical protein [Datura stramonium]